MKSLLLMLSLGLSLMACSSSSNDDNAAAGPGPFGKATDGTWMSECIRTDKGGYIDKMKLNGGSGTSTDLFYQAANCSGQPTEGDVTNFTWAKGTGDNVTLTPAGKPAFTLKVVVNGENMTISEPKSGRVVNYQRVAGTGGDQESKPGNGAPGNGGFAGAFDAAARGTWASRDCLQQNPVSFTIILEVLGNGVAKRSYNVFQNGNCEGEPRLQQGEDLKYTVNNWANGGGQVTVGTDVQDITIRGPIMTVNSADGTLTYQKIR